MTIRIYTDGKKIDLTFDEEVNFRQWVKKFISEPYQFLEGQNCWINTSRVTLIEELQEDNGSGN